VIRGGKAGRRGARWHKATSLWNFLALKGLKDELRRVWGLRKATVIPAVVATALDDHKKYLDKVQRLTL